jgi:hypothetical protein
MTAPEVLYLPPAELAALVDARPILPIEDDDARGGDE